MESLLSVRQVRDLLQVDRTTIYRMLKDGRLNGIKIGRHWRFYPSDLDELLSGAKRMSKDEVYAPAEILPLHCMQPVQDVFAEIAEIGSITADREGQPLTKISNSCDFCKLILGSKKGRQACIDSWKELALQKDSTPEFTSCHAGLQHARARIEVGGSLVAIQIIGQFYLSERDQEKQDERIQALAEKYRIDKNSLVQAAQKISVLDSRKKAQISGWLGRVAQTFEQISKERADLINRLRQIAVMSVVES
jgi:excisionase family DNA binding protein